MRLALCCASMIAAVLLATSVSAEEQPLSIEKTQVSVPGDFVEENDGVNPPVFIQGTKLAPLVRITAHVDQITINKLTANRGNCPLQLNEPLPVTLRFGDTISAKPFCDPIEVTAETDLGALSVTWDN